MLGISTNYATPYHQGLSGYGFWAVVGYGYALILCI